MRRFWLAVVALWMVLAGGIFGIWRVALALGVPHNSLNTVIWGSLAVAVVTALAAIGGAYLRGPTLALLWVTAVSLIASSCSVFVTFLAGRALFGEVFVFAIGPTGYIEVMLFLLICAIESTAITARVAKLAIMLRG